MGYKGFQQVEAKPNRRDKTKPRSEEHENELSPTAAAFRERPIAPAAVQAEKSKRLPGENPIDPKAVKADLKAAKSLQKLYASQTAPAKPAPAQQQKVSTEGGSAWGSSAAPASKPASTSAPTSASHHHAPSSGGGSGWGSVTNTGLRGASVLTDNSRFDALPTATEFAPDTRHAGGPRQAKASTASTDANLLWKQEKKAQPAHHAQTLVLGKKVAPKHSAAATGADETADGAAAEEVGSDANGHLLPISVAPIALTADGKNKEIPLSGSLDKMAAKCEQFISGMPRNANAVANLPIRAGLFMTVAGKKFSDVSTIFEPWMAESYFKALLELVEKDDDQPVLAAPYYCHSIKQGEEPVEAKVSLRIVKADPKDGLFAPTTAIEIAHVDGPTPHNNKAQLRKVRVSFKSFAQGMVRAGEGLVSFRETLEDVLEKSPLKGAAGAEITKKFAGKFNATLAKFRTAIEKATA